jgi:dihydroxyacetone kinase-like protein
VDAVIAIAGGSDKVSAILGAIRGGYVKTLITDTVTARAVLEQHSRRN